MSEQADYPIMETAYTTATDAKQAPQVEIELRRADERIEMLDKELSILSARLGCVLRDEPETADRLAEQPREVLVALADRIRHLDDGIHNAARRIRSMTHLLEL